MPAGPPPAMQHRTDTVSISILDEQENGKQVRLRREIELNNLLRHLEAGVTGSFSRDNGFSVRFYVNWDFNQAMLEHNWNVRQPFSLGSYYRTRDLDYDLRRNLPVF
ncbi:MAG: hypothetical protein ACREUR_09710 [Nitrosospira sp.]